MASLFIATSTIDDGAMSGSVSEASRFQHRRDFLRKNDIEPEQTILVALDYNSDNFCRFSKVTNSNKGDGITRPSTITSDALFTDNPNVALFLPVADCVAAVLYDPTHEVLGLLHLGRHNLLQQAGTRAVDFMREYYGSVPSKIHAWLGPGAGKALYPLYDFNNKSLHEVAVKQLTQAGVSSYNISIDPRDTTMDETLYSHSQFLKGEQSHDGRQAVVCMMQP